jgi:hypothetical protein
MYKQFIFDNSFIVERFPIFWLLGKKVQRCSSYIKQSFTTKNVTDNFWFQVAVLYRILSLLELH